MMSSMKDDDEEGNDKRLSKDKIFKRLMDIVGCEVKKDKFTGNMMLFSKHCSNCSKECVQVGMVSKDDCVVFGAINMPTLVDVALMHAKSFILCYYDHYTADCRESMKNPVYGCKTLEEMAMKLDLHSFQHHEWDMS